MVKRRGSRLTQCEGEVMIRITQLKLPVDHRQEQLRKKIARTLKCGEDTFSYEIVRQSLDARHKDDKKFVYTVDVSTLAEKKMLRKNRDKNVTFFEKKEYCFPKPGEEVLKNPPVVVGSGPAGLFCAWYLARAGYRPLVLERGQEAQKRKETVDRFWKDGILDPESNVQFGEGGAGTFSDGKLNTLVKDPNGRNHEVLKRFVEAGAPQEIVYQQKPHLGTDVLIGIVVILVLSASMSTLSSLVLTSSSTLTLDFIKGNIAKNLSEKKQLLLMRILIVFFIAVSVILALDPPTFIAQLMGISWGALAGAFLAPFLYGLFWKGTTKLAVWASFITGVGITVANMFFKFIASPINAGAVAMVAGLIVVPVVSLLTPKLNKQKVDQIFTCYDEKVSVKQKIALPDDQQAERK